MENYRNDQLTSEELIRAIRLDLAAEHEAVHAYMAHADATDNPVAKAVLIDIANEERVHAGEFARLLAILTGDEDEFLKKGTLEVNAIVEKTARSVQVPARTGYTYGRIVEIRIKGG